MSVLDGKVSSLAQRQTVRRVALKLKLAKVMPCLNAILVGTDPASETYVRNKKRAAEKCGIKSVVHHLPQSISPTKLLKLIDRLNRDPKVDGILLQLPLPKHINEQEMLDRISPAKDVDGLHPENLGLLGAGRPRFVPCTPKGIVHILDYYGIDCAGKNVVIVGRSRLVGKPLALLMLMRHATVTVCHSKTRQIEKITRAADILVVAAGVKHMIKKKHVSGTGGGTKKKKIIVDVGIHRDKNGLTGDVHPSVFSICKNYTPVPGGVGPETIASLLANTVISATYRLKNKNAARRIRKTLHGI